MFTLGIALSLTIASAFNASAQDKIPPADWKVSVSNKDVKIGDVVEIVLKTDIPDEYHIYSNDFSEDCPPQKAKLTFIDNDGSYEVVGKMTPKGSEKLMDDIFMCEVSIFHHHAEFKQKIRILKANPKIKASLFYQMCTEEQCVNFDFAFEVNNIKASAAVKESNPDKGVAPVIEAPVDNGPDEIEEEAAVNTEDIDTSESTEEAAPIMSEEIPGDQNSKKKEAVETEEYNEDNMEGWPLWLLFTVGFGTGLLALLTPCVYPMIPMTVAFFTKQDDPKKGRKLASFYGLSILLIYLISGVALAAIFGEAFAYILSTHWLPNILFFLIFVVFAMSFFGMFELTLPSKFVNKMNAQSDRGGYLGVFFLAFTLVLVSFSCTAPIVGAAATLASKGALIRAVAAMSGFAIAFAAPFTIFAFLPQLLTKLPQSGGWLNSVKVILGFLELALSLKFLSQADLAYHWGILDRDVFLSIWIVLAFSAGMYLLGKLKFPHDSDLPRIPVLRYFLALFFLSFGAYLVPGLWGAPLKPLAGILPPMHTQDFCGGTVVSNSASSENNVSPNGEKIKYSDFLHTEGFNAYFNYDQALEVAKKEKKPIFVDFTGWTCANCRRMEEKIWKEDVVRKRLSNDFIMLSLYCDERKEVPEEDWLTTKDGEVLKTIMDQNLYRQVEQFGSNGQPSYYVMDWDENVYSKALGFSPDVDKYVKFLEDGKAGFEKWLTNQ